MNIYDLFGPNRSKHDYKGVIHIGTELDKALQIPTVTMGRSLVPITIKYDKSELGERCPVFVYTAAGLQYHPNSFGWWGTLVYLNPQSIYIIDGDVASPIRDGEDGSELTYEFNFGGPLKDVVDHLRTGWRFAVQAIVVYDDGSQKLTGWDFLQVV